MVRSMLNLSLVMMLFWLSVTLSTSMVALRLAAGMASMVMGREATGLLPSSFHDQVRVCCPSASGIYLKVTSPVSSLSRQTWAAATKDPSANR